MDIEKEVEEVKVKFCPKTCKTLEKVEVKREEVKVEEMNVEEVKVEEVKVEEVKSEEVKKRGTGSLNDIVMKQMPKKKLSC